MHRLLTVVFAALPILAGCGAKNESPPPPAAVVPAAPTAEAQNTGKILQLQQAGPYTYAEVERGDGQKIWIAGAHLEAKEGDTLQWGRAEEMRNFSAKSLGRNFDRILFVSVWGPAGGSAVQVAPHGNAAVPHPPMGTIQPATVAAPAPGANRGEVVSTTTTGGYTYVEVKQEGGNLWIAGPETAVKAGDKVSWDGGTVMQNFNAKSLNRTFDRIVFAGSLTVLP